MPLRLRLAVLFAIATALALASGGLLFLNQLRADLNNTIDSGLRAELADLAQELTPEGRLPPLGPADDPILIERLDGTIIAASPAAAGWSLPTAQRQAALTGDLVYDTDIAGANSRVLISTVATPAPTGRVVVALGNNTDISDDAVARVERGLLLAGPLATLLAGLGAWQLADAALRPVERMRRQATNMGEYDPEPRLAIPATHDEVAALGATINALLHRLNSALERERRFVADASRELRTPLANLRTELELAIRPGRSAKEQHAILTGAAQVTERLTSLTEDLFLLSRADNHQTILRTAPIHLTEPLTSAVSRARDRHPAIELHCPEDLRMIADPDRLSQAIGNLIDNAVIHSPLNTAIKLTAGRDEDGHVVIEVSDAGPGLDPQFLPLAFERFQRAEHARSCDPDGTGLGLSIVRAIAEAHGGSAHIANGTDGGTRATIELPLIPPMTSNGDTGPNATTPNRARLTPRPHPQASNPWHASPPRTPEPEKEGT